MTWLDVIVLAGVLLFAIRGFLRGTVAQVFVAVGLVAGLALAGFVAQWIGAHWADARPTIVFVVLRWLVATLAGLAVAALFQWWGELLGGAVKGGVLGWLDRLGGVAMGALLGVVAVSFVLMAGLLLHSPREVGDTVARTRVAAPLMRHAVEACALGEHVVPGSRWLKQRFSVAEHRARRIVAGTARNTRT